MVSNPEIYWCRRLTGSETTTTEGSRIELIIGFVADSALQPVKRPTDDDVGLWYYHVCLPQFCSQLGRLLIPHLSAHQNLREAESLRLQTRKETA